MAHHLSAGVALALSCALFAASCVQSESPTQSSPGETQSSTGADPSDAPTGEAREPLPLVKFTPQEFPFVTVNPDDGKEEAGGWQQAKANLTFRRWHFPHLPRSWPCSITVQMPLRTKELGHISPSRAATITVPVAEDTARTMDYDLPTGIFCDRFRAGVLLLFRDRYPALGARVLR